MKRRYQSRGGVNGHSVRGDTDVTVCRPCSITDQVFSAGVSAVSSLSEPSPRRLSVASTRQAGEQSASSNEAVFC